MGIPTDFAAGIFQGGLRTLSLSCKRWRKALTCIYSYRVMLSIANEILARKKNEICSSTLSSPSYVTLHVQSQDPGDNDTANERKNAGFLHADPEAIAKIIKDKDMDSLHRLGGPQGAIAALETNAERGISDNPDDVVRRKEVFGSNTYKKLTPRSFFYFAFEAFKDRIILILLGCALLSLAFGIKEHGLKDGWYEGGTIYIAVFLVVGVSAVGNFRQSKQFVKLSNQNSNINVDVVRSGRRQQVSIFDVVVGDVVSLKIGDQIPADGLFLSGHSLQVDESSMTGESDHVNVDANRYPFLISGAKVVDGYATMIVTSVGIKTMWGEMMSSIRRDSDEQTPLQARLDKLATFIGKFGLAVAFLVLIVVLARYFTGNTKDDNGNREFNGKKTKIEVVINSVASMFAAAVTIVVVAIPEGLPLAVTLTLAYSMKRMMSDNALVRKLSACETMGSATITCTDKTGTLTLNQMKVTRFWIGEEVVSADEGISEIDPEVLKFLHQGVGLNSTGSVYRPNSTSLPEFSGSPTEKAILSWAVLEMGMDTQSLKQSYTILQVEAFNSEKKRSGVLVRENSDRSIHLHWKGAAEMILSMCSNCYESNGTLEAINEQRRMKLEQLIEGMAAQSLRCIAFAYKQIIDGEVINNNDEREGQKASRRWLDTIRPDGLERPLSARSENSR
ncbi:putative calcium-transporting ATPase 13, plasma membrane-type [Cinnamomum micranthum f. kanehirae]|uniref:Putative calcium-transporting ATPase 13, plasma membrane-type n=1 Tax=Cinnamomum micranthum f. kanehirae TaxID=337451 RepID=A0A3S3NWH0_9MAGN|nr:putative calcium-transporting ATPase 13, plasma membrane-type [Cinnamomum micranthum f. kanehirae]